MDFVSSDSDQDEATQHGIEQSLLQLNQAIRNQTLLPEDECRILPNTKGNDSIYTAIKSGDEKALRELSLSQHTFSEADSNGWIPLHEAAIQNNQTILEITHAASSQEAKHCQTLLGKTPLFLAVEKGLLENATFLLRNGSGPDCKDENEDSPLFIAIRNNQYDMAKLLLCFKCNVNLRGMHQRSPLHEAARLGLDHFVELLLRSGADPDPRSAYGLTPLALAAQCGHLKTVQTLLGKGACVNSQAMDSATILFEAAASGHPGVIALLLEYGADANVPKYSGHLPIHRVAHRGHLQALELLVPVTTWDAVEESGMSPLHSAAAGGHTQCLQLLLTSGYDPNFMLHRLVQNTYDDKRRSALYFAVSNDDVPSARLLLEGGAMPNQDPIKCLQVAMRLGNYELVNTLLRYGANVNYYSRVNTTHFPSALQYALKDEVLLRMLCNYGYDIQRCFDCPYGERFHVPLDYEGWTNTVIKDTLFCEVITLSWLRDISGHVVRTMLDYVDQVTFCSKLKAVLMEQEEWPDIRRMQENVHSLQHLCRLKIRNCLGRLRLRAPIFMSFIPLPDRLKEYILYREYDIYSQNKTSV